MNKIHTAYSKLIDLKTYKDIENMKQEGYE